MKHAASHATRADTLLILKLIDVSRHRPDDRSFVTLAKGIYSICERPTDVFIVERNWIGLAKSHPSN
jgi:hypothetical protein